MAEDGARLYEQARRKDTDLDRAWEEIRSINDRVEWDYENILPKGTRSPMSALIPNRTFTAHTDITSASKSRRHVLENFTVYLNAGLVNSSPKPNVEHVASTSDNSRYERLDFRSHREGAEVRRLDRRHHPR
jgi:hypothetical protein